MIYICDKSVDWESFIGFNDEYSCMRDSIRMIVISDGFKKRLTPKPVREKDRFRAHKEPILLKGESNTIKNIELYSWGNQAIPSVFDYETIVLDMNIAASDKRLEHDFRVSRFCCQPN